MEEKATESRPRQTALDAKSGRSRANRLFNGFLLWLEPEDNPSGVVYGTIAVGAVLATESSVRETYLETISATIVVLALYWFAHTYARVVGGRVARGESLTFRRLGEALSHEWAIVKGAAIPVLVVLGCWAGTVPLRTGLTAGLWTSAGGLATFEVLAAVRSTQSWLRVILESCIGIALGAGLLLIHVSLS